MHAKYLLPALIAGVLATPLTAPNVSGDLAGTQYSVVRRSEELPPPPPRVDDSRVVEARWTPSEEGGSPARSRPEPKDLDHSPPAKSDQLTKRDIDQGSHVLEARTGILKPSSIGGTSGQKKKDKKKNAPPPPPPRKSGKKVTFSYPLVPHSDPPEYPQSPRLSRNNAITPHRPQRPPHPKRDVNQDSHGFEAPGERPPTPKTPKDKKKSKWPKYFKSGSPSINQPPLDRSQQIKHQRMPQGEELRSSANKD